MARRKVGPEISMRFRLNLPIKRFGYEGRDLPLFAVVVGLENLKNFQRLQPALTDINPS